jgi:hypothetical protein
VNELIPVGRGRAGAAAFQLRREEHPGDHEADDERNETEAAGHPPEIGERARSLELFITILNRSN